MTLFGSNTFLRESTEPGGATETVTQTGGGTTARKTSTLTAPTVPGTVLNGGVVSPFTGPKPVLLPSAPVKPIDSALPPGVTVFKVPLPPPVIVEEFLGKTATPSKPTSATTVETACPGCGKKMEVDVSTSTAGPAVLDGALKLAPGVNGNGDMTGAIGRIGIGVIVGVLVLVIGTAIVGRRRS